MKAVDFGDRNRLVVIIMTFVFFIAIHLFPSNGYSDQQGAYKEKLKPLQYIPVEITTKEHTKVLGSEAKGISHKTIELFRAVKRMQFTLDQEMNDAGQGIGHGSKTKLYKGKIQPGDTAVSLLGDYLTPKEIHDLSIQSKSHYPLSQMEAGKPYVLHLRENQMELFEYEITPDKRLSVAYIYTTSKGERVYDVMVRKIDSDLVIRSVTGTIDSSLFGAVAAAGEQPELAIRIAEIFAWEIDFFRDIRQGDSFTVLVEKRLRHGEFIGYGQVHAVRFINQGDVYEGFLFHDDDGRPEYYTSDGKNLRKAFLKAPLKFSRISSGFTYKRLHPIKKVYLPHPAIDYAAPRGTPVWSVGEGTVITVARGKGAGKYVKVRHLNGYESAYLHLSRFGKGIRKGRKVKQGDLIGYVGSTGMSTGPHLDFRMKRYGKYINPRAIKNPRAESLHESLMPEFSRQIFAHRTMMEQTIAENETKVTMLGE